MVLKSCSTVLCKPLHHLYLMSLRDATIPQCWKVHKITPIFKSGNRNSVKCYRPISLLSNVFKILEWLIYSKIITHLTNCISSAQFGFLRNRSTLQQLILFTDKLFSCNSEIDTIYFDIRKAFDSVSHNQPLTKLWSCGITGKLWSWFQSYLYNRFQKQSLIRAVTCHIQCPSGWHSWSTTVSYIYINDIFHLNMHSK